MIIKVLYDNFVGKDRGRYWYWLFIGFWYIVMDGGKRASQIVWLFKVGRERNNYKRKRTQDAT